MTVAFDEQIVPAIYLEQSARVDYVSEGTLPRNATLSTRDVRIRSSFGGLDVSSERAGWLEESIEELTRWLGEPQNWDGYGSKRISVLAARRVYEMLRRLATLGIPRPFVTGTASGGINLQWETEQYDLQVTIEDSSNSGFYWNKQRNEQWEGPLERAALLTDALRTLAVG